MWSGVGFWRGWGTGAGICLVDSAAALVAWSPFLSPGIFSFARIGPGLTFSILVMYTSFFLPLVVCTLFIYLLPSVSWIL